MAGGGDWVVTTTTKPSRSDEVLDAEEQLMMARQIRTHFESMAPKRPKKPNRSEVEDDDDDDLHLPPIAPEQSIPELHTFRALRSHSPPICSEEPAHVQEEFVETQYYKELHSIDKQHHTTGNGFIKVTESGGDGLDFHLQGHHQLGVGEAMGMRRRSSIRSNPATNEWIPRAEEEAIFISRKPSRSEGCMGGI